MKKIYSLFSFVILLIFAISCNSDDNAIDKKDDSEISILGHWTLSKRSVGGKDSKIGECESENTFYYFKQNGNYEDGYGEIRQGTSNDCIIRTGAGNYVLNEDQTEIKIINNFNEWSRYKIIELSKDQLIIEDFQFGKMNGYVEDIPEHDREKSFYFKK